MLVFIDSPHHARLLHSSLAARYPGQVLTFVWANQFGVALRYAFPRGLSWGQYPLCVQPAYELAKATPEGIQGFTLSPANDPLPFFALPCSPTPPQVLIVTAGPASSVAWGVRLSQALSHAGKCAGIAAVSVLKGFDARSIQAALDQPLPPDEMAHQVAQADMVSYFDYNFAVNSAGLLTRAYREIGGNAPNAVLSKYTVQALYFVRRQIRCSEERLYQAFHDWKGTGKYTALRASLGRVSSHPLRLAYAKELGLLTSTPAEGANREWQLSAQGHALLARLHPGCEDQDLPFRLAQWQQAPADALPQVARYLKTWFGRQKRHNRQPAPLSAQSILG